MMSVRAIRGRIKAAKNIQQITRAMKLVSAARLRRAQDRALAARPYAEKMREVMVELGRAGDLPPNPLLEKREIRQVGTLILTSDRGLCGSFNLNVIRKATDVLRDVDRSNATLFCMGKRGHQFFSRRDYQIAFADSMPNTGVTVEQAMELTNRLRDAFESGSVDAVHLVFPKFISPLTQIPTVVQLLPIEPPVEEGDGGHSRDFLFEPPAPELLAKLLPRYLFNQVFQALLEASASEHGARMTAMSMASDNAGKMIKELTLTMNRMRQASITKEILEVVSGAEALK
ncbi:MAG: ATP synthase F1 subunit gamma [Armatimonadetes bacterium]|nr:ATP synthase F1 subunit gamma [Armatimonadota bacterium]